MAEHRPTDSQISHGNEDSIDLSLAPIDFPLRSIAGPVFADPIASSSSPPEVIMRQPQSLSAVAPDARSDKPAMRHRLRAYYAEYYDDLSDPEFLHLLATVSDEQLAHLSSATDVPVTDLCTFRAIAALRSAKSVLPLEPLPVVSSTRSAVLVDFTRTWKLSGDLVHGFTNEYFGSAQPRFIFQIIGTLRRELTRIRADIPSSEDARILRDIMSSALRGIAAGHRVYSVLR